jgi:hypothetical protein
VLGEQGLVFLFERGLVFSWGGFHQADGHSALSSTINMTNISASKLLASILILVVAEKVSGRKLMLVFIDSKS